MNHRTSKSQLTDPDARSMKRRGSGWWVTTSRLPWIRSITLSWRMMSPILGRLLAAMAKQGRS